MVLVYIRPFLQRGERITVVRSIITSSTAASELTNGSINSLRHVIDYDSRKPELSTTKSGLDEEGDKDVGVEEFEDSEEILKDQVWDKSPAFLPTFNVGAYANESENVRKLVQLGVDLSKWEGRYGTIPLLYKSNFDTTMQPIIEFLIDAGVEGADLSRILSWNPYIFNEDLGNLKLRLEYLRLKKFTPNAVVNMITRNPYWLSVPRIDRRLGFYQTYFNLTGDQVRVLASVGSSGPKLITYHLGRVKDVTFTIKEEMGFTSEEIVKLLLTRPRIWKEVPVSLRRRFDYLHNEEKFSHADFLRWPMLLLTRERRLKERIGFLRKLGRAQFSPEKPNYISAEMLCTGTDADFATDVAKVGVVEFNNYLKTL
ncbi:Transcription termination factor 3, mitochondrial [Orchesella cincta]|uniref:Transcription termination factor 3, mitochondrial n=1 Tax=Orchesella cincta TaxID=48709 RepID=A0A1D2N960_ORCCI|nr:Transcription termination factor 3, mitochondrial [Orchesella cincta]